MLTILSIINRENPCKRLAETSQSLYFPKIKLEDGMFTSLQHQLQFREKTSEPWICVLHQYDFERNYRAASPQICWRFKLRYTVINAEIRGTSPEMAELRPQGTICLCGSFNDTGSVNTLLYTCSVGQPPGSAPPGNSYAALAET